MTFERISGSAHSLAVTTNLYAANSRSGSAIIGDHSQSESRAVNVNDIPVSVVANARRDEYPTITNGGAGVARALRMSAANGRRTDQRSDAPTTWKLTTKAEHSTAASCDAVGIPDRREARTKVSAVVSRSTSTSTKTREPNAARGETGKLSRHSAPRPSRHHEFTPNNSAPPEATSPGRMASIAHSRPPANATRPGRMANTASPRRSGTERQIPTLSVRTSAAKSEAGLALAARTELSTRSSSRAARRATAWATKAPATTAASPTATSPEITFVQFSHTPWEPYNAPSVICRVGALSRIGISRSVAMSAAIVTARAATTMRMIHAPNGPRRTHSDTHAATCARLVATISQSSTGTCAANSPSVPTTKAVAPSTAQPCISQAMLSGAISSAPRWSVVGLTGNATACSRGRSSRPPPDATAELIAITSTPAYRLGSNSKTSEETIVV